MPHRRAARALLSAVLLLSAAAPALAAAFKVTSTKDDGPGTLRWAVTQNNANQGDNVIDIAPAGKGPFVIKLKSLLPPLKGPLAVKGPTRMLDGEVAPAVAIDGSLFVNGEDALQCPPSPVAGGGAARDEGAPAAAPAPARGGAAARSGGPNVRSIDGAAFAITDTGHVRISNLEIRSFCIGVMILRSHDNQIDHNWIHNTAGAAGVLVTGDDGKGGSTSGLTVHNVVEYNHIYETGDGGECTRGTADLVYRFNMMWESRKRPGVPYSQGVECAGAGDDRISFIGNSFTGYSDGLQLNSATNVLVAGNSITGTTYGITAAGSGLIVGNVFSGNRMAIGPSAGSHITISRNSIADNGHADILSVAGSAGGTTDAASPNLGGIVFVSRGGGGRGGAVAAPPPPAPPAAPTLDASSAWDKAPLLDGSIAADPNAAYHVEFFASHALDASGKAQGEVFIGAADVTTDAQGAAQFHFTGTPNPLGDGGTKAIFTATATGPGGATSAFSAALSLGH